jgi:hypothetical protein
MWRWCCSRTAGTAIAITLALAAGAAAPAEARARADSSRVVKEIRISDRGIRITDARGDTLSTEEGENFGATVDIGGQKVHVRGRAVDVSGDGRDVRVVGPVVLVNGEGADMVRVFADAEVPAGERVEGDVVAVFGSVTVRGQVSGNAVAVFGSVRLDSAATVDGDAVAIGGTLELEPGASVSGQSVSFDLLPVSFGLPALPIVLFSAALGWLFTTLGGWLFFLIMPDRMLRVAVTTSRRTLGSLLLGLAFGPLLVIAVVLLLVTVIGIPVALLLPLLAGLMAWAGQIAATYVVGCKLLRRDLGEGGPFLPLALGTLFVAAFFVLGGALAAPEGAIRTLALFFFLLGVLLSTGLTLIGSGAFLLSRLGAQPREVAFRRHAAPAGTAAPAAPGAAPPLTGA